jgi:hypothetical protein
MQPLLVSNIPYSRDVILYRPPKTTMRRFTLGVDACIFKGKDGLAWSWALLRGPIIYR